MTREQISKGRLKLINSREDIEDSRTKIKQGLIDMSAVSQLIGMIHYQEEKDLALEAELDKAEAELDRLEAEKE